MKAMFKVGDVVRTNNHYRREGQRFFGKMLQHRFFEGAITKVIENTNDEKDGSGDVWTNFYEFDKDITINERFLDLVQRA
jgi:hypothetical protein